MKVASNEWFINGSFFISISILSSPGMCDLGKISSWLDLDSEDEMLRRDSEITLKQEIAWASHLSLQVRLLQYSMVCELNRNWFSNIFFSHYFVISKFYSFSRSSFYICFCGCVFCSYSIQGWHPLDPQFNCSPLYLPNMPKCASFTKSVSTCKLVLDKLLITCLFVPKCLRDVRNVLLSFVSLHRTLFSFLTQW